ncbi:hypothetical protein IFR05_015164 [Cadophora sp. M221]|nr:hypothetical protein IFR05_015164 [Cadophora sp. M221]
MSCVVLFLAFFAALTVPRLMAFGTSDPLRGLHRLLRNHHKPKLGTIGSLSRDCSQIGIKTLEDGGNAADAQMVATEICIGVVGMCATGLGSGGFVLIRAPNGSYEFVDFRPSAPAAAFENMFVDNGNASLWGGLASAVPGELRARDGFVVSQDLVDIFYQLEDASFLTNDPVWATDFSPTGTRVKAGDVMTRKRYAELLEVVSLGGADAFYTGKVAENNIATIRAANGTMSLEDLRDYRVLKRKPLDITYRGFKVTSCGVSGSGSLVLSVMKTIEGYSGMDDSTWVNMSTYRMEEAMTFGYSARMQLGDKVVNKSLEMIEDDTASNIRSNIFNPSNLPISDYDPAGIEVEETPSTSHISAIDSSGLALALTSTINLYFGSRVMVPETGLIMNNLMNDFSTSEQTDHFGFASSPANFIVPGKRPLSAMSPTIVEKLTDGNLHLVIGGAGGSHVTTAIIQCLWNVLDRNLTIPEDSAPAPTT